MHALDYPAYEYIIQRPDGLYYCGSCRGGDADWSSDTREGFDGAFGYTESAAHARIQQFPGMFQGCKVVRR
jgi:hypothetical protein